MYIKALRYSKYYLVDDIKCYFICQNIFINQLYMNLFPMAKVFNICT